MKNYTWDEAKYAIPYTDTIICVTDRNNELYIGENGEWVPVVSHPAGITLTNCADEMPPDDDQLWVIGINTTTNRPVKIMANHFHMLCRANGNEDKKWTPYTLEKWKYLNK